jgi:hypothetical protein
VCVRVKAPLLHPHQRVYAKPSLVVMAQVVRNLIIESTTMAQFTSGGSSLKSEEVLNLEKTHSD